MTSAVLHQLRRSLEPEKTSVRPIRVGGLEGREVSFQLNIAGQTVHEVLWLAVQGTRSYIFALAAKPDEMAAAEPYLKRLLLNVRFKTPGLWDEEFEKLRTLFLTTGKSSDANRDVRAAELAAAVREGRQTAAAAQPQMAALLADAPDAALDWLIDKDANVRAVALVALSAHKSEAATELLWRALRDPDAYARAQAAGALNARAPALVKSRLGQLADTPDALLQLGAWQSAGGVREWINALLAEAKPATQRAALRLALAFPDDGLTLPVAQLLVSNDQEVPALTIDWLRKRRDAGLVGELTKLLAGDTERWAVRALGEVGATELLPRFAARSKELDERIDQIFNPSRRQVVIRPVRKAVTARPSAKTPSKPVTFKTPPPDVSVATLSNADFQSLPEETRLAVVRGEYRLATEKIKLRDLWGKAADETARRALLAELPVESDLAGWARNALATARPAENHAAVDLSNTLTVSPTGATLFPADATLYLQAPHPAQTLARFDAGLGGIQMEGVRDQMAFTIFWRNLKTILSETLQTSATTDKGAALGVDFNAPMALAAWPAGDNQTGRSAFAVRVTDRARFARFLAQYQQQWGDFANLAVTASGLARLSSALPSLVTFGFTPLRYARPGASVKLLSASVYQRQETLCGQSVTVIERLEFYEPSRTEHDPLYLAYIGDTAILAPSRDALAQVFAVAAGRQPALAANPSFPRAAESVDELVYFSRLNALLGSTTTPEKLNAGTESGAVRLPPNGWETVSRIKLDDASWLTRLNSFRAADLALPQKLWPRPTLAYAGAVLTPNQAWDTLKQLGILAGPSASASAEKALAPKLQGEVGLAVTQFNDLAYWYFGPDYAPQPAVFAARLQDAEPARLAQAQQLFKGANVYPIGRALFGRPVFLLPEAKGWQYVVVTDEYLLAAATFNALQTLEQKEKIAATRDWARTTAATPEPLRFFATYNPEAFFNLAREQMPKNDAVTQYKIDFLSAWTHAFHSQRAVVTAQGDAIEARLAVSFDRAGRYSVEELTRQAGDFDVAHAIITPRGLALAENSKLAAVRLRVRTKQPGLAAQVRREVSVFPWQTVESGDEQTLVYTINRRPVPEAATARLPVAGLAFKPYLQPTGRINSNAPEIVKLAREIAGKDRDARSVAGKLGEWTFSNLKWKKVESVAVETLASREADCLEHSELYVALARSLGLPARVVTGAAYSGGSFGAHAWVEIYLGRWVEIDPTWGTLDGVDATHLRFDGQTFTSYAMLNQIELEILEARNIVFAAQRDPVKLAQSLGKPGEDAPALDAFDFPLTLAQTFSTEELARLTDKQKQDLRRVFTETVETESGNFAEYEDLHILAQETQAGRTQLLALRGDYLLRLTLAARGDLWYVTEIEEIDYGVPAFADALRGALKPSVSRNKIWALEDDAALTYLDELAKNEGEGPRLALLKAAIMRRQARAFEADETPESKQKHAAIGQKLLPLLTAATARWPDYAPLYHELAHAYLEFAPDKPELAAAACQKYCQLEPRDPRLWQKLAQALEKAQRWAEAEAAYREAVKRDANDAERLVTLSLFHFRRNQLPAAKEAFLAAGQSAEDIDYAFTSFNYGLENEIDKIPDGPRRWEQFYLSLAPQLARSSDGLTQLARLQNRQNRYAEAMKTMQRVLALKTEPWVYEEISRLSRAARRYPEALAAADQALKLDEPENAVAAFYERACALAQLGRLKEALAALQAALKDADYLRAIFSRENDLKPLAEMPEFKEMVKQAEAENEVNAEAARKRATAGREPAKAPQPEKTPL